MARVQLRKRRTEAADDPSPDPSDDPSDDLSDDPSDDVAGDPADRPAGGPPTGDPGDAGDAGATGRPRTVRRRVLDSAPVTLAVAAHPRQGVATALALGGAALVSGRPAREAGIVALTVLVGQCVLGWHNDLVDRDRDEAYDTARKPIAQGRLDPGTAWYAVVVAVLLVIPLSLSVGVTAGLFYLASLVLGILANVVLRQGRLSPVLWMASFALYPAYLSYGGYGGSAQGDAPQVAMVVAAAFLGLGVHVLRAIWGLVEDDQDGWTYLPLALGRRLGATRLLAVTIAYLVAVVAVLAVLGSTVGLRQ